MKVQRKNAKAFGTSLTKADEKKLASTFTGKPSKMVAAKGGRGDGIRRPVRSPGYIEEIETHGNIDRSGPRLWKCGV